MVWQGSWVVLVGLVFSVIESGFALRCWKCTTDQDATCRDYFNTTRILLNQRHFDSYNYGNLQPARTEPHMIECDGMHTSTIGQYKNVCLKRVYTVQHGPDQVVRECRMVHKDLKLGACPDDIANTGRERNMEFCGTCEYDGCNSASRTDLVLACLVPAVILLLRK